MLLEDGMQLNNFAAAVNVGISLGVYTTVRPERVNANKGSTA